MERKEDRNLEIEREESIYGKWEIHLIEIAKEDERENGVKIYLKKNMAENFPIVKIDITPELQDICKHQENIYKKCHQRVAL